MGEAKTEALIHTMAEQRVQELRTALESDLEAAWKSGVEAGKAEGFAEGEFRGRKQGVIRVAMNCLRAGLDTAIVAKAAELPEPIIKKLAQDNGIEIA